MIRPARPTTAPTIVWFRNDLRLADNPAVAAADGPVHFVYVAGEADRGRSPGGASRWWLHHSLRSLSTSLARIDAGLTLMRSPAAEAIPRLAVALGARRVVWCRRYDHAGAAADDHVARQLARAGVDVRHFNGALLVEPWEVATKAGGPLKVFGAFRRAARERGEPPAPGPAPTRVSWTGPAPPVDGVVGLDDLELLPKQPDWAGGLREAWTPGEDGARLRLSAFVHGPIGGYATDRDRPDSPSTSRLSPHLRFGEISPRQVWHAAVTARETGAATGADVDKFHSELMWREFSYHLLHYARDLAGINIQSAFDAFPWRRSEEDLTAWQHGRTGYPIVDAGMRELWTTGWMHNRVRMIAASFLAKHLLIDWREGERWFWDTLVDADPANNPAGWQWVAGSGADAAPFFRIFNPVLQGEKFDPNGAYVRRWVPELADLPCEFLHRPWSAPPLVLRAAGVILGKTYPAPIVEHPAARARALAAFESIRR